MSWAIVQKVITLLSTTPSLNVEVGFNLAKWKMTSQAQICAWNCPQRAVISHPNAWYITKQQQNSVWCSLQNQCLGQSLFGIFLSLLLKKKNRCLFLRLFPSSLPQGLSLCLCAWVLGSWVSNVRPCTELSKRRMGWDDWWLGGLKLKPPLQMLLLQKSQGYPRRYIQGHLRTVTPTTFGSQQAGPFTQGLTLFSAELTPSPFRPSSAPSRTLAQTSEYLIPVK